MTAVAAPIPEEHETLQALIEEARRRARQRRQRYAAVVALAAAAGASLYFGIGRSGSGSAGPTVARLAPRAPVQHFVRRPARNGPLTVISGNEISAISSRQSLRTLFRCSANCYEFQSIAWSPDGKRLAFGVTSVANPSTYNGLHIIELATGKDRLLRDVPGDGWSDVAWSPLGSDGFKLAYVSGLTIYIVPADGRGSAELRTGTKGYDSSPSWSPDGTRIAFASRSGRISSIYTVGIDGSHRRLLARRASAPAWSPDGRMIAYRSACGIKLIAPSGRDLTPRNSYRCDAIGLTAKPVWSPDGKKIAFAHLSRDASFAASGTYVMNADGTRLTRVSRETGLGPMSEGHPAWRPLLPWRPPFRRA